MGAWLCSSNQADCIVRRIQQTPSSVDTVPYSIESYLAGQATIPLLEKLTSLFHQERGRLHLHSFKDCGNTLTATDTHGDNGILASSAVEFVQGFYRQDTARCRNGVTE